MLVRGGLTDMPRVREWLAERSGFGLAHGGDPGAVRRPAPPRARPRGPPSGWVWGGARRDAGRGAWRVTPSTARAARLDALSGATVVRSDFRTPSLATADLAGRTLVATRAHGKHLLTRLLRDGAEDLRCTATCG